MHDEMKRGEDEEYEHTVGLEMCDLIYVHKALGVEFVEEPRDV